jgi:hypothetical protein
MRYGSGKSDLETYLRDNLGGLAAPDLGSEVTYYVPAGESFTCGSWVSDDVFNRWLNNAIPSAIKDINKGEILSNNQKAALAGIGSFLVGGAAGGVAGYFGAKALDLTETAAKEGEKDNVKAIEEALTDLTTYPNVFSDLTASGDGNKTVGGADKAKDVGNDLMKHSEKLKTALAKAAPMGVAEIATAQTAVSAADVAIDKVYNNQLSNLSDGDKDGAQQTAVNAVNAEIAIANKAIRTANDEINKARVALEANKKTRMDNNGEKSLTTGGKVMTGLSALAVGGTASYFATSAALQGMEAADRSEAEGRVNNALGLIESAIECTVDSGKTVKLGSSYTFPALN